MGRKNELRVISYIDMTKEEKLKAWEFLKSNDGLEEGYIKEIIKGKIYSEGKGMFFCFFEGKIIAKGFLVMETIRPLECGYIHKLSVLEEGCEYGEKPEDKVIEMGIKEIVDKAEAFGRESGARDVRLGFSDTKSQLMIKSFFNEKGSGVSYRSFVMELTQERKALEENLLELKPVSEITIEEYIKLYNNSFEGAPHRGFMEIEEAREAFEYQENVHHYIVVDKDKKIGFLDFYIDEAQERGKFDLGILKEFRGKGYGKKILETAIFYLVERNLKVELIVLEPNELAYNMYLKRGFKVKNIMGNWIIL